MLWGYTPIVVHRSFVVSTGGTLVLLPVRAVLFAIRLVEEHVAGRSFDLSRSHGWIGLVAAAVGAAVVAAISLLVRSTARAVGARRRPTG
ncbi:MAG TPA: hypothetical protein VG709_07520 [Actinomycetota bacterium]|nr:hypothetical protein [Actinomycetota bacterium]